MSTEYNPLPGIETYQDNMNPTLCSPYSSYEIKFYQTRETLNDVDTYRQFLKNVELQFRHSTTYTRYKGFVMGLGLDHCQIHGYLSADMVGDKGIEMHHCILTLFDLALIITEYMLNTVGYVTTFDVVQTLKEEHKLNHIALVMLSKTAHQVYHSDSGMFIHPSMCFGQWWVFLEKYMQGMTQDVAFKLLYYFKRSIELGETLDNDLLRLRDNIIDWSEKHGYT